MSTSNLQQDLATALNQFVEDKGKDYAAGFLSQYLVMLMPTMKKTDQKAVVKAFEYIVGEHMVERTNLMSGEKFMEARATPISCSPASETYWSA
jgi:hypothetical protein